MVPPSAGAVSAAVEPMLRPTPCCIAYNEQDRRQLSKQFTMAKSIAPYCLLFKVRLDGPELYVRSLDVDSIVLDRRKFYAMPFVDQGNADTWRTTIAKSKFSRDHFRLVRRAAAPDEL